MKKKEVKKMEREEIRALLEKFSKKHGTTERISADEYSDSKEINFYMRLPDDVISGWSVTAGHGIEYPTFLVEVAKKIAEPYKWWINVQDYSPEDDPTPMDAWCYASKNIPDTATEEDVEVVVKEASEILEKVRKAITKHDKQLEEIRKKVERAQSEKIDKFIADL